VDLNPIAPGTTFVVALGQAHVMGAVQVAGGRRIFCVMLGPPLAEGWQAEYESYWVVEDIALRDGSWLVRPPDGPFEAESIPRFAATAKDGTAVLAVYDPLTLHITDVAPVRSEDEQREWERAPTFMPTDVRTFEHALANTMQLTAPDAAVHPYDAQADEDRLVLAMTRERASDVTRPLPFTHVLRFRDRRKALTAADEARALGYGVRLDAPHFRPATLEITNDAVPSYQSVRPEIHRFRAFADRFGAEYDGFEAEIR
jgi:hypothetical protein